MTRDRLLSSAVGIPLMILLIYFGGLRSWLGGALLVAVFAGVVYLAIHELLVALVAKGFRPEKEIVIGAGVLLVVAVWISECQGGPTDAVVGVAAVVVTAATLATKVFKSEIQNAVANVGSTVLGFVYVAGFLTYFLRLRLIDLPSAMGHPAAWSFLRECGALLFVFLAAWMTDTGAWFFGRRFGRRPMSPVVSPKKTIEGGIAGVLTGTAFACLGAWCIDLPLGHGLILGLLVGIVSQIGDLSESVLKRDLGIKDSSQIIPGHGGVLDRFDSLLFAMPFSFYYLKLFVLGG
jgi:phosphatidate cytidylyltransferase